MIILGEPQGGSTNSGYNAKERLNVLRGGMETHNKLKELEKNGKRSYYRSAAERKLAKAADKGENEKWFSKRKDDKNKFTSVMFVEATPNGELVDCLRKIEEKYKIAENKRIKFVEKSGIKLINIGPVQIKL